VPLPDETIGPVKSSREEGFLFHVNDLVSRPATGSFPKNNTELVSRTASLVLDGPFLTDTAQRWL
jgi:hypothetical protein